MLRHSNNFTVLIRMQAESINPENNMTERISWKRESIHTQSRTRFLMAVSQECYFYVDIFSTCFVAPKMFK